MHLILDNGMTIEYKNTGASAMRSVRHPTLKPSINLGGFFILEE